MPGGASPFLPYDPNPNPDVDPYADPESKALGLNDPGPLVKFFGQYSSGHGIDAGPLGHIQDPTRGAYDQLNQSGMPGDISGADAYEQAIKTGLAAGPRGNPYSVESGNQSRDALEQALEHLHHGTSTIGAQAARSMGNLAQAGAGAVADAGGGLGALRASHGVAGNASDIANQAGQGGLQEWMTQQGQYGQGLGDLRQQDLSQMSAGNNAGLEAQKQDNALQTFYAGLGSNLQNSRDAAAIERYKAFQRAKLGQDQNNLQAVKMGAEGVGTLAKTMA